MAFEEVKGEDYTVTWLPDQATVEYHGTIRLQTTEDYEPILSISNKAQAAATGALTLDVRNLEFLNSSGINMFSRFIMAARRQGKPHIRILGTESHQWQQKSVSNFQKLWSDVEITMS